MTYKEALNSLIVTYVTVGNDAYIDKEAFEIARRALEKQIPRKVAEKHYGLGISHHCPVCNKSFDFERSFPTYCPDCGQRIDWKWK